jgi:DNA polymerase III alpha subunit
MTSLLQNTDPTTKKFGDTLFDKYIKYAISGGVTFHKPDINESKANFRIKGNEVWYALGHVRNVSNVAPSIEKFQPYTGIEDFYNRCRVGVGESQIERRPNSRVVESLIYAGAFDSFGTKEEVMKDYYRISGKVEKQKLARIKSNIKDYIIPCPNLSFENETLEIGQITGKIKPFKSYSEPDGIYESLVPLHYDNCIKYVDLPELTPKALVAMETEVLGIFFSENFAIKCRDLAAKHNVYGLRSAKHQPEKTRIKVLGLIEKIGEYTSKAGNNYLKVLITDGLWNYSFACFGGAVHTFKNSFKVGDVGIFPLKNRGYGDENPNDRFFDDNGEFKLIECKDV